MNINASVAEVSAACTTLGVSTTAMEDLIPSGTRVVCQSAEGALALRGKFRTKIIEGSVTRSPRAIRYR